MAIFSPKNNKIPKAVNKKKVVRNNNIDRKKVVSDKNESIKVKLTKYEGVNPSPEYFSYLNDNGEETKFSGIIINDDNSYLGKQILTTKVELTYHPKVESVKYSPEHFTFIDNNGKEKPFAGNPEFDLDNNAYVGTVIETVLHDQVIEIFEEK